MLRKNRSFELLLLLAVIACQLSACRSKCPSDTAEKIMGRWYMKVLKMPDSLELMNNALVDTAERVNINALAAKPGYYIVHYLDASCSKCIEGLRAAQKFMLLHEGTPNVKYFFIVDGPTKIYADDAIRKLHFKYPVYYEKHYYQFLKLNNLALNNSIYNTMLINNQRQLIVFGDVFDNKAAEKLYYDLVAGCK